MTPAVTDVTDKARLHEGGPNFRGEVGCLALKARGGIGKMLGWLCGCGLCWWWLWSNSAAAAA